MSSNIILQVEKLTSVGISLSKERNLSKLLELILIGAKEITHADGGTLYLLENDQLKFEILRTDSLGLAMGGSSNNPVTLKPIKLYSEDNKPNLQNICAHAAITGHTVNIADAYSEKGFDFRGTKTYDSNNHYHSKSFLTVPMKNHENEIIGVLQLINALESDKKTVIPFSLHDQRLAESLASQAAIALTNFQLIEDLRNLLEKFIEVIAHAIDEKSPYTGGHCRRVPEIANLIAQGINDSEHGKFKDISFSERELYEINIAGLLHDCGKITTPVHVVDKGTKLEAIFNRIELIDQRIQLLKKDAQLQYYKHQLDPTHSSSFQSMEDLDTYFEQLDEDFEFLTMCNRGSEFMAEEAIERLKILAKYTWFDEKGDKHHLLNDEEMDLLSIPRGTLAANERDIINNHIVMTQKMLNALPFPKHLKNVPEIAGNHHERMDGKGYPNQISGDKMSIQARLMCIADIFEALTAADRPYKKAMNLSTALTILGKMRLDSHIDPDIFEVFVSDKIYLKYAEKFLDPEQIDEIDIKKIPGFPG